MNDRVSVADRLERLPISNYHKFVLSFLFFSYFCLSINSGGTGFIMPLIIKAFNITTVQGGYFSSIGFLGMAIGSLFGGAIADKLGRKKVIILCMVIWGIGGLFMAFAQNTTWLFVARFFQGIGLGTQTPVGMAYLSELLPTHSRAKYMTLYTILMPLGIAFGGLLTVLILPSFDWRGCYFVEALFALALFLVGRYCTESCLWLESRGKLKEADALCEHWEAKVQASTNNKPLPPVVVRKVVKAEPGKLSDLFKPKYFKILVMCLIYMFCVIGSDWGLSTWLTTLLVAKGFTIIKSTGYVTIGILGAIPSFFFSYWFIEKIGRKWGVFVAAVMTAIFAYLYGQSSTVVMLIVCGALYQFAKYALAMCNNVYVPELFETHVRGLGCGYTVGCGRIGAICCPIFLAMAMTGLGATGTFTVAAGLALLAGVTVLILGPETKGKELQ